MDAMISHASGCEDQSQVLVGQLFLGPLGATALGPGEEVEDKDEDGDDERQANNDGHYRVEQLVVLVPAFVALPQADLGHAGQEYCPHADVATSQEAIAQ